MNRWKSIPLWTAIIAQILSILVLTGAINVAQSDIINSIVAGILQLLVTFGVFNNPTDNSKF